MEEKKFNFKDFIVSPLGKVAMIIVLYFLIWGLMLSMTAIDLPIIAVIFAVVLGYFGWKALNRITPDMFLFMSISGWAVYFLIKGMLSIFIGVFVAPFVIAKKIATSIQENIE